jgi:hypothetical protein
LKAAQDHATRLKEEADLLSSLLDARIDAEKAMQDMIGEGVDKQENFMDLFESWLSTMESTLDDLGKIEIDVEPPDFSPIMEKWMEELEQGVADLLPNAIANIKEWWRQKKEDKEGIFGLVGLIEAIETIGGEIGEIFDRLVGLIGSIVLLPARLGKAIGLDIDIDTSAFKPLERISDVLSDAANRFQVISELIQLALDGLTVIFEAIGGVGLEGGTIESIENLKEDLLEYGVAFFDLFGLDFFKLGDDLREWGLGVGESLSWVGEELAISLEPIKELIEGFTDAAKAGFPAITGFFRGIETEVAGWNESIGIFFEETIPGWFTTMGENISIAVSGLWETITQPFVDVYDFLVGNSLVPDLVNGVVGWILSIPTRLLEVPQAFYDAAVALVDQIVRGFHAQILGADGLLSRVRTWLSSVGTSITEEGGEVVSAFIQSGLDLGTAFIASLKHGIETGIAGLGEFIKGIWNNALRPSFQALVDGFSEGINGIVVLLNNIWMSLGSLPIPGFPLPAIEVPQLPTLQFGGTVLQDMTARIHAGETVMQPETLGKVIASAMGQVQQQPAFAPTMQFFPGSDPSTIVPAVSNAYDLYKDKLARGV